MDRVHVGLGIGDEAHMNRPGSGRALPEPENIRPFAPKPLRSGWPGGPSLPS